MVKVTRETANVRIGAGPAGLTAAYLLGKAQQEVCAYLCTNAPKAIRTQKINHSEFL